MIKYEENVFNILDENSSIEPAKQIRNYVESLEIEDDVMFNKIYQKLYNQHYRKIKKQQLQEYHAKYRKENREKLLKYNRNYYYNVLKPK